LISKNAKHYHVSSIGVARNFDWGEAEIGKKIVA